MLHVRGIPRMSLRTPSWQVVAGLALASLVLAGCGASPSTSTPATTTATPAPVHQATLSVVSESRSGVNATAEDITVSATCTAGKVLVGGGYHLQLASHQWVSIRASYPSAADTWTVSEANPQSGGAVTLTAYALCLASNFPVTTTITTATSISGTGTATCPAGKTLVGGGFSWPSLVGSGSISASYPTSSGWQVAGTPPPVRDFTLYAVCASGLAPKTMPTAATTIGNNAEGEADVACGNGALLIGGGFATNSPHYLISEDNRASDSLAQWMAKWFNLYAPDLAGSGPTPTPPPPMQLVAYAICVTPA